MRQSKPVGRQTVLFLGAHLAKGAVQAVRQKHGIVAETLVAAWRPYRDTIDTAFEILDVTVRPGEAQRGDKMRAPPRRLLGAEREHQIVDAGHRAGKIFVRSRPARRMDAGFAVKRIDAEARIVRKGDAPGRFRRGLGLDPRVRGEGRASLLRLRQAKLSGRLRVDA